MGGSATLERFQAATPHRLIAVVPWRGAWLTRPAWFGLSTGLWVASSASIHDGETALGLVFAVVGVMLVATEVVTWWRNRRVAHQPRGWLDRGVLVATDAGILICRQGKPTGSLGRDLQPDGRLFPFPLQAVRLGERRGTIVVTTRASGDVTLRVEDPALAVTSLQAAMAREAALVAA